MLNPVPMPMMVFVYNSTGQLRLLEPEELVALVRVQASELRTAIVLACGDGVLDETGIEGLGAARYEARILRDALWKVADMLKMPGTPTPEEVWRGLELKIFNTKAQMWALPDEHRKKFIEIWGT